ncbi:hypothetical protein DRQ26_04350 [bacterium]|nr:MAG: hypothetical protein DRQ26_04350 [bacterium]
MKKLEAYKMKWTIFTVALFGVLFAQPMMPDKSDPEIMERIETVKMWKLTEALDLSEEQAAKLFPVMNRANKRRKEIKSRQMELFGVLRDALDSGADSTELLSILDEMTDLKNQECELQIDFLSQIKQILSPEQQAKYVMFEVEFKKRMMQLLRDFHRGKGRRRNFDNPWEER